MVHHLPRCGWRQLLSAWGTMYCHGMAYIYIVMCLDLDIINIGSGFSSEDRQFDTCNPCLVCDDTFYSYLPLQFIRFAHRDQCGLQVVQLQVVQQYPSLTCRGWGVGVKIFSVCTYSQLRPPRATAAQSGGAWAAPTGRTAAGKSDQIWIQSKVVGQYTKPRCYLPWYGSHHGILHYWPPMYCHGMACISSMRRGASTSSQQSKAYALISQIGSSDAWCPRLCIQVLTFYLPLHFIHVKVCPAGTSGCYYDQWYMPCGVWLFVDVKWCCNTPRSLVVCGGWV